MLEPILLWGGQKVEHRRLNKSFDRVVDNRKGIIKRHFPLVSSEKREVARPPLLQCVYRKTTKRDD